ncbi:MAG: hypothetical protein WAZ18_06510 [Alphaproteobacteria bacterium]
MKRKPVASLFASVVALGTFLGFPSSSHVQPNMMDKWSTPKLPPPSRMPIYPEAGEKLPYKGPLKHADREVLRGKIQDSIRLNRPRVESELLSTPTKTPVYGYP